MATTVDRIALNWERHYPWLLGVAGGVVMLIFSPKAFKHMVDEKWKIEVVYLAIFELSSIFTAFSMTFYTFIITTEARFIGRIRKSIYFAVLLRYILVALLFGGILTLVSIPMMLIEPYPNAAEPQSVAIVALWAGLTVATVAAFFRAARLFSVVASQQH